MNTKRAGQTALQRLVEVYEQAVEKGNYRRAELLHALIAAALQQDALL
jgi:hypothetical protein